MQLSLPSEQRTLQTMRETEEERNNNRKESTQKLYETYTKQFARWCHAGPNEWVDGLKTAPHKLPYEVIPTQTLAHEFIKDHLSKRPQWNRNTRKYDLDIQVSTSSLRQCAKALAALYDLQRAQYPTGPVDFQNKYGGRPNEYSHLTTTIQTHAKTQSRENRKHHKPRGKGAMKQEGYTSKQNQQLFEFSLTNDSICGNLNAIQSRIARTHHALAHNNILRFDDRQKILISQFCCCEAPEPMEGALLLVIVLDWRKTNSEGTHEAVHCLRHRSDPARCNFFAFAHELYSQIHFDGAHFEFNVEDFKPYRDDHGRIRHPWYDRRFFYGNSRSGKGTRSSPSPNRPTNYNTVNNYVKHMYEQIKPPIKGYHTLHLQRGNVARAADAHELPLHQIVAAGWKAKTALETHYLTGVPMQFVRWVCGYKAEIKNAEPKDWYVARNVVQPPKELVDEVFPFVAEVEAAMAEDPEGWKDTDETLGGFLELCRVAAGYYLQDVAVLQERISQNPIFATTLFNSQMYHDFRHKLLEEMKGHQEMVAAEEEAKHKANSNPYIVEMLNKILDKLQGYNTRAEGNKRTYQQSIATESLENGLMEQIEEDIFSIAQERVDGEPSASSTTNTSPVEGTDTYFGTQLPTAARVSLSPMKKAQLTPPPAGVDLLDRNTWPTDHLPNFAQLASMSSWDKLVSPRKFVQEYAVGPPALRDLEAVYGPHSVVGNFQKNSWRKGSKSRTQWSNRQGLHELIDSYADDLEGAINELERIVAREFGPALVKEGTTASKPGPSIMGALCKFMSKQRHGAAERSAIAKARHQRKRERASAPEIHAEAV